MYVLSADMQYICHVIKSLESSHFNDSQTYRFIQTNFFFFPLPDKKVMKKTNEKRRENDRENV